MFLIVQVQYVLGNKNVERFVYNFISILQIHMCVKITIWNIWNGSNRPIWNTKVCYDHSTGTKVIDLLCITDRRWFAHFYERQNFKEECNPLIVFPRLSPLVHIIEILVLVFKGRNLGFWESTPTQPHRVRCLLQLRDAVGKTSPLWSTTVAAAGSILDFFSNSFFLFQFEFTRNAPIGQRYAQNLAQGPAWKQKGNEDILRLVRTTDNRIGKLHWKLTITRQSNNIYIGPFSAKV